MTNVASCERCNRIFQKSISSMCPNCAKVVNDELTRCHKYLNKYAPNECTIETLSKEVKVPREQIIDFIKKGKLLIAKFPNLRYECKGCKENLIYEGEYCPNCMGVFNSILKLMKKEQYIEPMTDEMNRLYRVRNK